MTDQIKPKTITIDVRYLNEKEGIVKFTIHDRRLFMRSEEQEQAFHPQSNDYPYGNNVLYLSKMTLELIHSNLTLKSTQQDGTTLSFTVVTMPVLVVNLSMDLA